MIIHVGGNEIQQEDPETITQNLINMLTHVRSIMPLTKIYFSNILPRLDESYIDRINYINNKVSDFGKENNIRPINHIAFCPNGIDFSLLSRDLVIHPSFKGTSVFAKDLIAAYRNYRN